MMKFAWLVFGAFGLSACAIVDPHPPTGFMDAPAIEFRNAEGVGRWCPGPDAPGMFSKANFRACREELTARGYQEIGPWCGGEAPTGGETAAALLLGGIRGLVTAQARAAHHAACQRRGTTHSGVDGANFRA